MKHTEMNFESTLFITYVKEMLNLHTIRTHQWFIWGCNATAPYQDEGGSAAGDVDKVVNGVNGMGINAQDQLDEEMIRNIIQFIRNMLRMTVFSFYIALSG